MTYVITSQCSKDDACVSVCPVDCIYSAPEQMVIDPDYCIDCDACRTECPVDAIVIGEKASAKDLKYNLSESAKLRP